MHAGAAFSAPGDGQVAPMGFADGIGRAWEGVGDSGGGFQGNDVVVVGALSSDGADACSR